METDRAPSRGHPEATGARDGATTLTCAVLLVVTALAWWHTVASPMGHDMAGMEMTMTPTVAGAAAYVGAWGLMMAAMMLPSALPMIALYGATQRRVGSAAAAGAAPVALFALVYLVVWAISGLPIYLGSLALMAASAAMLPYLVAGVLIAAGLFQLTSLKQACLSRCRSPLAFLLGHWRSGWWGALRMGGAHALYCLGCCWALMVVLVAAGAMGLPWVLLIACVVAAEKLLPRGEWIARAAGIALVGLGMAVAARPGLAMSLRASPFM